MNKEREKINFKDLFIDIKKRAKTTEIKDGELLYSFNEETLKEIVLNVGFSSVMDSQYFAALERQQNLLNQSKDKIY